MGIFEDVKARRAAWVSERRAAIEEARQKWLGRVVSFSDATFVRMYPWLAANAQGLIYGQVTEIDERGAAMIVYAYTDDGEPMWRQVPFEQLGVNYGLVDA